MPENNLLYLLVTSGIAPLMGVVGSILLRWWDKRKERREADMTAKERFSAEADAQAAAVNTRLENENARLTRRLQMVEKDRDNGWDLARYWFGKAHEIQYNATNAFRAANGRFEMLNARLAPTDRLETITFTLEKLPALEEPIRGNQ